MPPPQREVTCYQVGELCVGPNYSVVVLPIPPRSYFLLLLASLQVLVEKMLEGPTERVTTAGSVILSRVHLYEVLGTIRTAAQRCLAASQSSSKVIHYSRNFLIKAQ